MNLIGNPKEDQRQAWLIAVLGNLPKGAQILDAGAGEFKNKPYCTHLEYVSHYFCQYHGAGGHPVEGMQSKRWVTSRIDLVSDITAIPVSYCSFDAILCGELLEHDPEPTHVFD